MKSQNQAEPHDVNEKIDRITDSRIKTTGNKGFCLRRDGERFTELYASGKKEDVPDNCKDCASDSWRRPRSLFDVGHKEIEQKYNQWNQNRGDRDAHQSELYHGAGCVAVVLGVLSAMALTAVTSGRL